MAFQKSGPGYPEMISIFQILNDRDCLKPWQLSYSPSDGLTRPLCYQKQEKSVPEVLPEDLINLTLALMKL